VRRTFAVAQGLTVAGYLLLPTAPPRLLPSLGLDATASTGSGTLASVANHLQHDLAALPSGHVVFALVVAQAWLLAGRSPAARAAAVGYPVLVAVLVLATANHLLVDVAGAAVVVAVATSITWLWSGAWRPRPAVLSLGAPSGPLPVLAVRSAALPPAS
jgi:hypothetical protein